MKLTLFCFYIQAIFQESLKHQANGLNMLLNAAGKKINIIQIHKHEMI